MKRWMSICVLGIVLASCQQTPAEQPPLPTLIDINAVASSDAATALAQLPTAPPVTPSRTPLPPTWTASPIPLPTATALPPTPTPVKLGTIFFIFNDDSIVALKADGSSEELIAVGNAPSDLSLSPDGKLLAYAANGNGSAREIFVSNLEGTAVQQVSCLGFARVIEPTWRLDGKAILFAGSQTPEGPLALFLVNVEGSNQCPTGNQQRQIIQLEENNLASLSWNPTGEWVYFGASAIYGVAVGTGLLTPRLTSPTGFGPDFSPVHHPKNDLLVYLKSAYDDKTRTRGGTLYQLNTAQPDSGEVRGAPFFAQSLRWSQDGNYLLIATDSDIWVQEQRTGSAVQVFKGSNFFPQPTFSPDASMVAYVDGGRGNLAIQQVFVIGRDGGAARQLTNHGEGSIAHLVWTAD